MLGKLCRIVEILTYVAEKMGFLIGEQNIICHNLELNNYKILKKVHKFGTKITNIANLKLLVF